MALIYLRHPLHGEKAESNDLVTYLDKKNGWVEFDPNERSVQAVEPVIPAPPVAQVIPDFLKATAKKPKG